MPNDVLSTTVTYNDNDTVLEGFMCKPRHLTSEKLPAVIVCHAFGGITEFEKEQTHRIAQELDVIALAHDIYGKGKRGTNFDENLALMKPFRDDRPGLLRNRLLSAINFLETDENFDERRGIAVIGYCFGGMCALDLARINARNVVAVASIHGTLLPLPDQPLDKSEELEPIKASILVCHGDSDTHIPPDQVSNFLAELRDRRADWYFTSYGNAKHAFTEPKHANSTIPGVGYNKNAAERSWAAMVNHLRENLAKN